MDMKRNFLLLASFLFLGTLAWGQEAKTLIGQDPARAANNLHAYEFHPVADTPAPAGFAPVYISHYGRHGSRHDISSSTCDRTLALLSKADSLGQLTAAGKALLEDVRIMAQEHVGMGGELSWRGGREHDQLAARMAERFPAVFVPGKEVNAIASTVQRSIVSMAYFMASLRARFPESVISMTTGERYTPVTRLSGSSGNRTTSPVGDAGPGSGGNRQGGPQGGPQAGQGGPQGRQGGPQGGPGGGPQGGRQGGPQGGRSQQGAPAGDFSAFYATIFVNPAQVRDKEDILTGTFKVGSICEDLDFLGVDIYKNYFTVDELYLLWAKENDSLYSRWGNSVESGYAYGQTARPLVDDMIDKADAALAGDKVAADLRFGHDQPYMALCDLLGIDADGGERFRAEEAHDHWYAFDIVPTAANVQLVFYRDATGEVLVKVLRNEKEVALKGLQAVSGPYYRWADFKEKFGRKKTWSIEFDPENFIAMKQTIQTASGPVEVVYKAYMHIPYVTRPLDTDYQSLCIFEPVFIGGKSVDASDAPILFSNRVGGYMPVDDSRTTDVGGRSGGDREALALAAGFVVVVPGCRGRTVQDADDNYIGKAPAVLVDLKAAVRYLRHNKGKVPGDTDRMISVGCSAGGAVSAALGASGNSPLFEPYLKEIGAADERDDFFATGVFSPIMDLQHGDMAYEWEFGEVPLTRTGELVDQTLSAALRKEFAAYEKSLKLGGINGYGRLTADNLGEYIARYWLNPAATLYLQGLSETERTAYLADKAWLKWDGTATHMTMEDYNRNYSGRYKALPAFDTFDLHEAENGLFGNTTTDAGHFTGFSLRQTSGDPSATLDPALQKVIDMMNPFTYISNKGCAKHWWIRHGTTESGISRAAMVNFSTALMNKGKDVNSKLFWDAMHCVDKDPQGFVDWMQEVCK